MSAAPIVYYIALGKTVTAPDITEGIGREACGVVVNVVTTPRRPLTLDKASMVVVDLDGVNNRIPASQVLAQPIPDCLIIVPETHAVPADWLPLVRHPRTSLLLVRSSHPTIHPDAAIALQLRIRGMKSSLASAVNRRSDGLFLGLEDLVTALLNDPRGIRTPRDLADALQTTLPELQARCASLQLNRLEHVLTLIRCMAVEHLVADCHLTVVNAMTMVGIRDRSNFRRQWRRASYLVPGAAASRRHLSTDALAVGKPSDGAQGSYFSQVANREARRA